jgi:hypothetical protein
MFAHRHFNTARRHQGLRQRAPVPAVRPSHGKVVCLPVLGGLHHDYRRAGMKDAISRRFAK